MSDPQPEIRSAKVDSATRRPGPFFLAAALIVILLIWSFNYVVAKITLRHLDAFTLVSFRFPVAAAVALSIYLCRRQRVRPRLQDLWAVVYLGFFGILINQGCFTVGLSFTTSDHSVIVVALGPLLVLLFAWILRLEKMTAGKAVGMAVSIAGILLLETGRGASLHSPLLLGDLITLGGITGFAIYAALGKRVAAEYDAISMTTFNIVVAAILISPLTVHQALHLQ